MSAGLEALTVQEWIVATLSADAELADLAGSPDVLMDRIWDGEYRGKESEAPWWISFTCADSTDVKGVGVVQIMGRVRFSVKVVVRGRTIGPGVPVYRRAHQLLEGTINVPTTDGLVLAVERVSSFQYPERDTGMEYRHLGGQYEALSQ